MCALLKMRGFLGGKKKKKEQFGFGNYESAFFFLISLSNGERKNGEAHKFFQSCIRIRDRVGPKGKANVEIWSSDSCFRPYQYTSVSISTFDPQQCSCSCSCLEAQFVSVHGEKHNTIGLDWIGRVKR